jgi:hypothetical protein
METNRLQSSSKALLNVKAERTLHEREM